MGLEVFCILYDVNIEILYLLEVVVWINEEGVCFFFVMVGLGVWSGEFSLDYGWSCKDKLGVSIKEEFEWYGYLGGIFCVFFNIKVVLELYIE